MAHYPSKAVVGEVIEVTADVFRDGHDILAAQVRWRAASASTGGKRHNGKWMTVPMAPVVNDRWAATIEPTTLGRHEFVVEGWTDRYATWRHKVEAKHGAGQDISLELEEGAQLLESRPGLEEAGLGLPGHPGPGHRRPGPA